MGLSDLCGASSFPAGSTTSTRGSSSLTSDDPNDMLRLAAGRVAIADMEGSFHGLWEHLVTRIPLLEMGTDPLAVSTLNRCLCYVSLSRGDFDSAHTFANRLIAYCRNVGLAFPVSYVLVYRAMAEIGLRWFSAAKRTILEIEGAARSLGDPHLRFDIERVKIRLALATGRGEEWVSEAPSPVPTYFTHRCVGGLCSHLRACTRLRWGPNVGARTREGGRESLQLSLGHRSQFPRKLHWRPRGSNQRTMPSSRSLRR